MKSVSDSGPWPKNTQTILWHGPFKSTIAERSSWRAVADWRAVVSRNKQPSQNIQTKSVTFAQTLIGYTVPLSQLLQVIEERSFHGCRAVHSLSLSHSGLQEIQPGALKPLASLTRLDLGYNSLANLSAWHQVEGLTRLQAGERGSMEKRRLSCFFSLVCFRFKIFLHCKKKVSDFPAGMSLTILSLAGTGNPLTFFFSGSFAIY